MYDLKSKNSSYDAVKSAQFWSMYSTTILAGVKYYLIKIFYLYVTQFKTAITLNQESYLIILKQSLSFP